MSADREQHEAATKIQALHRGRQSRKVVAEKKRKASAPQSTLFQLPVTMQTSSYVDVRTSLSAIRESVKSWSDFVEALEGAGLAPTPGTVLDTEAIRYSTHVLPDSFPNAFSKKVLESILAADAAAAHAANLRAAHEAIEAAKPPPPPPPPPRNDDAADEDDPPVEPVKTKKQLREEAERRKADQERLKAVLAAEHDAACRMQKLDAVLKLHSLRIPLRVSRD